jgi:hypothetical protein
LSRDRLPRAVNQLSRMLSAFDFRGTGKCGG